MHVPVMHRFPDATGVAFALMACSRIHCLQLYLIIVLTKSIFRTGVLYFIRTGVL